MSGQKIVARSVLAFFGLGLFGLLVGINLLWYDASRMDVDEHHPDFWPSALAYFLDAMIFVVLAIALIIGVVLLLRWAFDNA